MSLEDWAGQRYFVWKRAGPPHGTFQLRLPPTGSQVLATLRVGRLDAPCAYLDSECGRFVLTGEGAGSRRVRISDAGTQTVVANFERGWTGRTGRFAFVDGNRLAWRRAGLLRPASMFTDQLANPLLRFGPAGDVQVHGLGAGLEPSIGSWRDLLLLLATGLFVLLLRDLTTLPGLPEAQSPFPASSGLRRAATRDASEAA
jgi:hypothetical protein